MSKRLVTYFSASGITAKVAENLADAIGADIFEIQPEVPYTKADLNWMDKKSRSTIEMSDPTSRPAIAAKRDNMDEYDTIFVGFPIWWYFVERVEPSKTFSYRGISWLTLCGCQVRNKNFCKKISLSEPKLIRFQTQKDFSCYFFDLSFSLLLDV